MSASSIIAIGASLLAVGILTLVRPRLRGTTLPGPWAWCVLGFLTLAGVEFFAGSLGAESRLALRLITAVAVLCPAISLLGAKRPQHRAWHLIVLSLWAMAAWPAARLLGMPGEQALALHIAQSCFLVVLVAVGLINLLLTRFWAAALLAATGQSLLLIPILLPSRAAWESSGWAAGLLLAGLLLATWLARRRSTAAHRLDRIWLDFRDSFGALWALRVAERVTAATHLFGWDCSLSWIGFRRADGSSPWEEFTPEMEAQLDQTLTNLLRRFVSAEWLAARANLSEQTAEPAPADASDKPQGVCESGDVQ